MLCSGEYRYRYGNWSVLSAEPYSVTHAHPIVNLWKRSMSITPFAGSAAANRSGRRFIQAPTRRPPFEPPWIASLFEDVYLFVTRYSAHAMKSSNTFGLLSSIPALCHASPYSPPPRRFATARRPPSSSHRRRLAWKLGVREMLNPP